MGVGGGIFQLARIFFSAHCLCRIFFQVKPSVRTFFETNIAFLDQSNLDSLCMFLCFINYSTLTTDQKGYRPLFNAKSFRKCTHSERGGSHLEWTTSLCIFSVPALWNSSPTAHHNDAILHSPKQPLCSALHSKMSIQKEGT